jgi:hypothetical protein
MRQSVLFLFMTIGALCALCASCRCSEPKQQVQKVSSLSSESAEPTTLGPLLDGSFQTTTTEHFVLLHEAGAGYVPGACRTLECAYGYFYEVFSRAGFDLSRSENRLVWICFPRKSGFSKYALLAEGMDLSWLDAYYSTLTNRVAIVQTDQKARQREEAAPPLRSDVQVSVAANRSPHDGVLAMSAAGQRFDVTRLTHELAHQLSFNSGIQKRGVVYPLWVSEGLATNFEFDRPVSAGLEHCNAARCNGLLETYAAGGLVPLREFVAQTTVPPDTHVGRRHYAQAWGFFQFVLTERPENLRTYLHRLAEERPDRRDTSTMLAEFMEAFGPPEALEESWNAFLMRLAQQALANHRTASTTANGDAAQTP